MSTETPPIVIDNGSGSCKIGFAGREQPTAVFSSSVGRLRLQHHLKHYADDVFVGDEAQEKRGILSLRYPLKEGVIDDPDDMERLWHYAFYNRLHADPGRHSILLTEPALNSKKNKKIAAELLFEQFNVPALSVAISSVLTLFSVGRTTGVVLESGDGVTQVVPVYDGLVMTYAFERVNLAGRHLTEHLATLLTECSFWLNSSSEKEIVREIKEQKCWLAKDYKKELEKHKQADQTYQLPDGQVIHFGNQLFRCPEALFRPSILGLKSESLPELVCSSVSKCDEELRQDLFGNVLVSGGTTLIKNFVERFRYDITKLSPSTVRVNETATSDRINSAWIGGSILGSLSTFPKLTVGRQEYLEFGANAVLRRFCCG